MQPIREELCYNYPEDTFTQAKRRVARGDKGSVTEEDKELQSADSTAVTADVCLCVW